MTVPEPTVQAAAPPLETGALWNLIDRAEHGTGTPQEARVLRRCVRAVVGRAQRAEAELAEWRSDAQHGAFTTCDQGVRHFTGAAFGRKIAEKRDALAQREQAVKDCRAALTRVAELEAELARLRAAQLRPDGDLTREIEEANHDPRWGAAPSYRCYMTRHRDCQPDGPEAGCTCGCHTEEAS